RVLFLSQAEDGIRDLYVTGVQTCALPITRLNSSQAEDGIRDLYVTGVQTCDRKSTRLNSSHVEISYAVFCLKTEEHTCEVQSRRFSVCRLLLVTIGAAVGVKAQDLREGHKPWLCIVDASFFFFFLKNPRPPDFHLLPPHAVFRM